MRLHTRVIIKARRPDASYWNWEEDRGAKFHDAIDIERVKAEMTTTATKRGYTMIEFTTRDAG